jgi:chromate reductase, NAD(P)H dehydrogenase (quinone)
MIRILAISGSLRASSSSNLLLQAFSELLPEHMTLQTSDAGASLPPFNDPEALPASVVAFHKAIGEADAILICTPEYAFGIPGALKNALDWTVGTGDFFRKPVAVITASSSGEKGHAALLLVLEALSADVIPQATVVIPGIRTKFDNTGKVKDPSIIAAMKDIATAVAEHCRLLSNDTDSTK